MKRIALFLVVSLTLSLHAQRTPTLKGNRQVDLFADRLDNFREVVLNGELTVELLPGISNRFELEADDNIKDVISMEVRDEVLYIDLFYRIRSAKALNLKIYYTELDRIKIQTGKVVVPEVLTPETLVLELGERSNLELKANVRRAEVQMEGSARAVLNVQSDVLLVEATGNANARIYSATGELRVQMEESANVELEGSGDRAAIQLTGNANLKAFGYRNMRTELELDGSAQADLWVVDELSLSSAGRSRTEFYGEPRIEISRFLNQSQLIKREFKTTE